jgi:hypothetical protein
MAKIHYLYKIENKLNGKIYIGIHSTENINDGYMGSGVLVLQAIEKYGEDNFLKTILEYCDSRETLVELEKKVVDNEFVARRDTYNLTVGGGGLISTWKKSNETIASKLKNDPIWTEIRSRNISLGIRNAMKKGKCSTATREFQMLRTEKSRSKEAIKKRKETYAKNKHQQGENNSRYGKKAIHNDITWKWVQKEEVEKYLNNGWKLGMLKTTKEN